MPDQMWVMRRFLPVTIPGIASCASPSWGSCGARDVLVRVIAVVVGVSAVVVPAVVQPVWRAS